SVATPPAAAPARATASPRGDPAPRDAAEGLSLGHGWNGHPAPEAPGDGRRIRARDPLRDALPSRAPARAGGADRRPGAGPPRQPRGDRRAAAPSPPGAGSPVPAAGRVSPRSPAATRAPRPDAGRAAGGEGARAGRSR